MSHQSSRPSEATSEAESKLKQSVETQSEIIRTALKAFATTLKDTKEYTLADHDPTKLSYKMMRKTFREGCFEILKERWEETLTKLKTASETVEPLKNHLERTGTFGLMSEAHFRAIRSSKWYSSMEENQVWQTLEDPTQSEQCKTDLRDLITVVKDHEKAWKGMSDLVLVPYGEDTIYDVREYMNKPSK